MNRLLQAQAIALTVMLVACAPAATPDSSIAAIEAATGAKLTVVRRLDATSSRIDFDKDGRPDTLAVVTAPAVAADYLVPDAFSYGPADLPGSRCLLVALADLTRWREKGGIRILCGRSPVLVLSPEQPVPKLESVFAIASRSELAQRLPSPLAVAAKGDAVILQTEAGESALTLTNVGFRWEELPGGE
jgi:hypothetical protein